MSSTASSPARCAVVVVNWNGGDLTVRCLRSLAGQEIPGIDVELVVVDNASTDGSDQAIEREFPQARLVRTGANLGFAGGANAGIRATSADYVVLVNNDAVAEPGFLAAIVTPLTEGPESLAAVTARIVLSGRFERARPEDSDAYRNAAGERWRRTASDTGVELLNSTGNLVSVSGNGRDRSWLEPADSDDSPAEVFGFCGAGAALRRSAFDAAGGFDDELFLYYEDTDLSWRLRRLGYSIVYAREAVLIHDHSASSGVRSRRFLVQNIRNRILVTAKNAPPGMLMAALGRTAGAAVKALAGLASRGRRPDAARQFSATMSALWRALRLLGRFQIAGRQLNRRAVLGRDVIRSWAVRD